MMKICFALLTIFFFQFSFSQENPFVARDFGVNGMTTFKIGQYLDVFKAAAFQSGKIVLGGYSYDEAISLSAADNPFFSMTRLNPDGTIDESFGINGFVKGEIGFSYSMAVKEDGKIILAGSSKQSNPSCKAILMQFLFDGQRDSTFADNGVLRTNFNITDEVLITDAQFTEDNKILVIGRAEFPDIPGYLYPPTKAFLARLIVNGDLDTTFANGGIRSFYFDTVPKKYTRSDKIISVSDNGILVSGFTQYESVFSLARFNPDGSDDLTFGNGGKRLLLDINGPMYEYRVLENEQVLLTQGMEKFTLLKLMQDDKPDTTYGDWSVFHGDVSDQYTASYAVNILIQENGQIILTGNCGGLFFTDIAFMRLNTDGTSDASICSNYAVPIVGFFDNVGTSLYLGNEEFIVFGSSYKYEPDVRHSFAIKFDLKQAVDCKYYQQADLLDVYPNPGINKLNFQASYNLQDLNLELFDLEGRKVLNHHFTGASTEIDVSELSGMYFYRVSDGFYFLKTGKIVVLN